MASRSPFTCRKQSWPDGEVTAKFARGLALGVSKLPREPSRTELGGRGVVGRMLETSAHSFAWKGKGHCVQEGLLWSSKKDGGQLRSPHLPTDTQAEDP